MVIKIEINRIKLLSFDRDAEIEGEHNSHIERVRAAQSDK